MSALACGQVSPKRGHVAKLLNNFRNFFDNIVDIINNKSKVLIFLDHSKKRINNNEQIIQQIESLIV